MRIHLVDIPASLITDWASFHAVFQQTFGFPGFYGRNLDAWIDCMGCIDEPGSGLTGWTIPRGDMLGLRIAGAADFMVRCPEHHAALVIGVACVNDRLAERGAPPLLALIPVST
ncbi:barstar family protein [Ancylobacter terrae]|uniref:barstar family protein n=1 Tax=Ancylobacter sp. sgz301288 TaxID=3342077 RepID=UPI00385ACD73